MKNTLVCATCGAQVPAGKAQPVRGRYGERLKRYQVLCPNGCGILRRDIPAVQFLVGWRPGMIEE